jgi:Holliday junction resolvase-like predicted endonuclease
MGISKGKRGEKGAKQFLQAHGWLVADRELQGLSGEDIFARDPTGRWWAVEVKNTSSLLPKYIMQARRQGNERYDALQKKLCDSNEQEREHLLFLGIDRFNKKDWLLMWHPSNFNCKGDAWVAAINTNHGDNFTSFIAPFSGNIHMD